MSYHNIYPRVAVSATEREELKEKPLVQRIYERHLPGEWEHTYQPNLLDDHTKRVLKRYTRRFSTPELQRALDSLPSESLRHIDISIVGGIDQSRLDDMSDEEVISHLALNGAIRPQLTPGELVHAPPRGLYELVEAWGAEKAFGSVFGAYMSGVEGRFIPHNTHQLERLSGNRLKEVAKRYGVSAIGRKSEVIGRIINESELVLSTGLGRRAEAQEMWNPDWVPSRTRGYFIPGGFSLLTLAKTSGLVTKAQQIRDQSVLVLLYGKSCGVETGYFASMVGVQAPVRHKLRLSRKHDGGAHHHYGSVQVVGDINHTKRIIHSQSPKLVGPRFDRIYTGSHPRSKEDAKRIEVNPLIQITSLHNKDHKRRAELFDESYDAVFAFVPPGTDVERMVERGMPPLDSLSGLTTNPGSAVVFSSGTGLRGVYSKH